MRVLLTAFLVFSCADSTLAGATDASLHDDAYRDEGGEPSDGPRPDTLDATVGADEMCNGIDDDLDGEIDEGFELCENCCDSDDDADECEDDDMTCAGCVHLGASLVEVCDDSVDNDCDGEVDEDEVACTECCDAEVDSDSCDDDQMICGVCTDVGASILEICGNGIDEDCDSIPDDGCGAGPWLFDETIGDGTRSSIGVDSSGSVHIAYSLDEEVRYAGEGSAGWVLEVIDVVPIAGNGHSVSLSMDSSDVPHVAYNAATSGNQIRWAKRLSPDTWIAEVVDTTSACCWQVSLAIDGTDGLHVSYSRSSASLNLAYAYSTTGTSWLTEDVSSDLFGGWGNSIGLDAGGDIHIAHWDGDDPPIYYSTHPNGGAWSVRVEVDSEGVDNGLLNPSLAVSPSGDLHIAYYNAITGDLEVAHREDGAGSFSLEVVDSEGTVGQSPSLVMDPSGGLHVVYKAISPAVILRYGYLSAGGAWMLEDALAEGTSGPDIAVDETGVHVSYTDLAGDVRYGRRELP